MKLRRTMALAAATVAVALGIGAGATAAFAGTQDPVYRYPGGVQCSSNYQSQTRSGSYWGETRHQITGYAGTYNTSWPSTTFGTIRVKKWGYPHAVSSQIRVNYPGILEWGEIGCVAK